MRVAINGKNKTNKGVKVEITNQGYIRFMMVEAIRRGETAVAEKCRELLSQNGENWIALTNKQNQQGGEGGK